MKILTAEQLKKLGDFGQVLQPRPPDVLRIERNSRSVAGAPRVRSLDDAVISNREGRMKKQLLILVVLAVAFVTYGCATEGYNTQKGAALGAVGGALAGQAIGRNTAGTLIGAAGGALVGAVTGNAVDQTRYRNQAVAAPPPPAYIPPPPRASEAPPGEWITVPGQWQGGKWVPAHRVWVPVNP